MSGMSFKEYLALNCAFTIVAGIGIATAVYMSDTPVTSGTSAELRRDGARAQTVIAVNNRHAGEIIAKEYSERPGYTAHFATPSLKQHAIVNVSASLETLAEQEPKTITFNLTQYGYAADPTITFERATLEDMASSYFAKIEQWDGYKNTLSYYGLKTTPEYVRWQIYQKMASRPGSSVITAQTLENFWEDIQADNARIPHGGFNNLAIDWNIPCQNIPRKQQKTRAEEKAERIEQMSRTVDGVLTAIDTKRSGEYWHEKLRYLRVGLGFADD